MSQLTVTPSQLLTANTFLTVMAVAFAAFIGWQGDQLTSRQWEYLMTVPGGKWSWAVTFGALGIFCAWGMMRRKDMHIAVGLFGVGMLCGFVASCYILAPIEDSSLRTGGWWPWIVSAAFYFAVGSVDAGDRQ